MKRLALRVRGSGSDNNALFEFESEQIPETHNSPQWRATAPSRRGLIAAVLLTLVVVAGSGMAFWQWRVMRPSAPLQAAASSLAVTTTPQGAEVIVDGSSRGTTPLALQVPAGTHTLTVRSGSHERTMTINASAGADIARDIEFPTAVSAPAASSIAVISEPPGANVAIDGKFVGKAPVTVTPLAPGTHPIVVSNTDGSIERTIELAAGENASVVFSMAKASATGWLQLLSPFDVQLLERDEVIGTSGAKIMMSAGRHDLMIVNRALGYQELRSVTVARGQSASLRIDAPQVAVSINARPWADVSIDGVPLGQTPLANATVAVGFRRIVFRHPDLGERQETAVITTKPGQRIAVDLTK